MMIIIKPMQQKRSLDSVVRDNLHPVDRWYAIRVIEVTVLHEIAKGSGHLWSA